jgi:hypothetical protein
MPYLSGPVAGGWAVIDVLVGVSRSHHGQLLKHGSPVPAPVHVRALLDTGASLSAFAPRVFRELGISPVRKMEVLTPSTATAAPHLADLYDVSLSLVAGGAAHPFPEGQVLEADCWLPGEDIEALIGMDILSRCFFQLLGPDRRFTLAF